MSPSTSAQAVVLNDFVNSVPSPLTFALVSLSDKIALLKSALQLLNWRSKSWFDGFLAIAAWWALCCFSGSILRYFLPIIVFGVIAYTRNRRVPPARRLVVTETLLQDTISNLTMLPILLPDIPQTTTLFASLTLPTLARAAVILYLPYLAVTFFIPLHLIFSVAGTVILTWQAPFSILLRKAVWRSAFVRWSVRTSWAYISGQPLPPKAVSPQTQQLASTTAEKYPEGTDKDSKATTPASLRFLFTVYENQRWWMGLDWTAALLPGERPSWCSASQAPLSPPGAFSLPEPTATYTAHPMDSTKKIKRTAEWYWEESEWRVLVKKEGTALSRVERPVPTESPEDEEGGGTATNTSSRLLKAASTRFAVGSSAHRRDSSASSNDAKGQEVVEGAEEDVDGYTDPDGWVYGDNKWESKSNKGGMSKYTRYRRWTRVAVLTEFTQVVDATAENTPDRRAKPPPLDLDQMDTTLNQPGQHPPTSSAPVTTKGDTPRTPAQAPAPLSAAIGRVGETPQAPESPLRQRLRMALNKGASGHS